MLSFLDKNVAYLNLREEWEMLISHTPALKGVKMGW